MSSDDLSIPEMDGFIENAIKDLPELFYVCDVEGNFIYWNDEFETVTGYDGDEISSMHPIEFSTDAERDRMAKAVRRIVEEGTGTFEGTLRTKDGETVPVEATGALLENGDGEPPYVYGTVRDITGRKQTEKELRESEARLADDLAGMRRLHDLHATLANETDLDTALGEIIETANDFLGTDRGCVQLVSDDGERLEMYEYRGYERQDAFVRYFLHEGSKPACDAARRNRTRLLIDDVETFPPFEGTKDREVALESGIRATQSTPLITREGELVGVLSNQFSEPHRPSEDQLQLIDLLAWTAAEFVERDRAEEEVRESEERQEFLLTLSDRIRDLKSKEEIGEVCTRLLAEEMELDRCYFVEFSPEQDRASVGPEYHSSSLEPVSGSYPYSAFPEAIKQIETETPVYDDVANDTTLPEAEKKGLLELDFGAWVGVPVRTEEKNVDRALYAITTEAHMWTAADVALVEETAKRTWEVVERARAEEELRESEERLSAFVTASSDVVYRMSPDWTEMHYLEGQEFLADTHESSNTWVDEYIPEDERQQVWETIDEAIREKSAFELEHRVVQNDGSIGWTFSRAIPLVDDDGEIAEWFGTATDITERKEREERQAFLLKLSDALRPITEPLEVQRTASHILREHLGAGRVAYAELDPDEDTARLLAEDRAESVAPFPQDTYNWSDFDPVGHAEAKQGRSVSRADVQAADDLTPAQKATFDAVGFRALINTPLLKSGRLVAFIAVHFEQPHESTPADIALVKETAKRTWDAVERARAEEELRESKERLQMANDAANIGTFIWHVEEDRIEADEHYGKLFGLPEGTQVNLQKALADFIRPDYKEAYKSAVVAACDPKGSGTLHKAVPIVTPDKEERWLEVKGEVAFVKENPARIAGTITDVTERKEREQRLERQREQIEELKDRLLETSPTGILVVDETGGITLTNDRATEILGMTREELVSLSHDAAELGVVDSNGGPIPDGRMPFEQVRATDETAFGIELGATRNDGQRVWLSVNVAPLYSESDEPTETVVAFEDITEHKQANKALAQLNDASRELMEANRAEITNRAAEITREVLNVKYASLWRYDDEAGDLELQTASTASGIAPGEIRYPDGFEERAWQVFVGKEMDVDNDLPPAADIAPSEEPIRSDVIVPLGRHGIICAGSVRPDEFDETTTDLAETVAANVETALDRADDEQQLEAQNTELTHLNRVNDIIREIDGVLVQADAREEIERVVCERLVESDLYEFAWIGGTEPGSEMVEPREWAGIDPSYLDGLKITTDDARASQGPVAAALRTRERQVVGDIVTDARSAPWRERTLARGVRSCISVPLYYEESLYGVLTVYAAQPQPNERECEVLEELGETIAHAINATETKQALGADGVIELGLQLREPDTPLSRLAAHASCEIAFEGLVPQSADTSHIFFTARETSFEEIRTAADESTAIEKLTCIVEREDDCLCKALITGPTLASSVVEQNATIQSLTIVDKGVSAVVSLSQTSDIREFVESIREKFPSVELTSRRTRESPMQTRNGFRAAFEERLTDRQQEVLRTAYLGGFFKSPRESTGRELAELLGVSQSTFAQHLRAGQHNHFELLFDEA